MINRIFPRHLSTPHIPFGTTKGEGISILSSLGDVIKEDEDDCLVIHTGAWSVAIYTTTDVVTSVWFDDPAGRLLPSGKMRKVNLYLQRYGDLSNWEMRLDNGWMRYWYNENDGAQMVYGIHKDVIRFNQLSSP